MAQTINTALGATLHRSFAWTRADVSAQDTWAQNTDL